MYFGTPQHACAETDRPPLEASAIVADWLALPVQHDLQYREFTSHDPELQSYPGLDFGNKDYNNFLAVCGDRPATRDQSVGDATCDPGLQGYLLAADDGSGFVTRISFPLTTSGPGYGDEVIRIYVDDLTTPAYEGKLLDWRNGTDAVFNPPLTQFTSGAVVSHMPIRYQRALRVLLDQVDTNALYYYQIGVQRTAADDPGIPVDQASASFSQLVANVESAAGTELFEQGDISIPAGASNPVLDERGAGTIQQLQLNVRADALATLRDVVLRISWDASPMPAVELPLATLFGCRDQLVSFDTLPLTVQPQDDSVAITARWPMPFFERAQFTLTNMGSVAREISVSIAGSRTAPRAGSGYWHALWNERKQPFAQGERYPVAALQGSGKYVGTLLYTQGQPDPGSVNDVPLGFLEGDAYVSVDGQLVAQGTGTEDYFDEGWYTSAQQFTSPFAALLGIASDSTTSIGTATMLRHNLLTDAVEFTSEFDLSFEYGADRPKSASDYASVAFLYLNQ